MYPDGLSLSATFGDSRGMSAVSLVAKTFGLHGVGDYLRREAVSSRLRTMHVRCIVARGRTSEEERGRDRDQSATNAA
jgi:hypothetical protein